MIKVYVKLKALRDMSNGWKKDDICEIQNNIFDTQNGFAYHQLDIDWKILEMKIIEYKEI